MKSQSGSLAVVVVCIATHFFAACKKIDASQSVGKEVLGADERVAVTSRERPWSAIGKLGSKCTGTLIAPRLVLTAKHCIWDESGLRKPGSDVFYGNMVGGQSDHAANVINVFGDPQAAERSPQDFAILILDRPLGQQLGTMKVASVASSVGTNVSVAGYAADKFSETAGVHQNCTIRESGTMVLHDCDTNYGTSGGPVFVQTGSEATIVALHVGAKFGRGLNVAVPAASFISSAQSLMQRYVDEPSDPPTVAAPRSQPAAPGRAGAGCLTLPERTKLGLIRSSIILGLPVSAEERRLLGQLEMRLKNHGMCQ